MARAAQRIQSQSNALARARNERRAEAQTLAAYGSTVAGAAGAAFLDSRWGEADSGVAELGGIPTNAIVGLGGMAGAYLMNKGTARTVVGHVALGMGSAAVYRLLYDKLEELEAKKADEGQEA